MRTSFAIALKIKAKHGILQKFIDEMNWTQSDFARALGLQQSIVGLWFNMQDYPRSPETMEKVCRLIGKAPEEIFPKFLSDPKFLGMKKKWTLYREVDLEFLPFNEVPELEYTPDMDSFDVKDKIAKVLKTLSPKEEKVIRMRFGLTDEETEHTLEEIAKKLIISRERVRQIEQEAIRKLQHSSRSRILECL